MIKENIAYEYKIAYTHNDIKCWKKKVGGKWYKITFETYRKEPGVNFAISNDNNFDGNYITFAK